MKTKLLPLVALIAMTAAASAQAHTHVEDSADIQGNGMGAYVLDTDGDIVRDSWNRCVRTNYWTADTAINKCEGIADPVVAAPVVAVPVVAVPVIVVVKEVVVITPPAKFIGHFDFDQADLKAAEEAALTNFANYLNEVADSKVAITGHTDSLGSEAYNKALSEKRAQDVADYLAGKGVSADRMIVSGAGETAPIADNATKAGRAENRRVEVEIVK
ncbi:MAG: OmpA family protein [Gammaproteobacteria bacterium]|nr:OmpA family protein [Gammaproteobacteria bacterium]